MAGRRPESNRKSSGKVTWEGRLCHISVKCKIIAKKPKALFTRDNITIKNCECDPLYQRFVKMGAYIKSWQIEKIVMFVRKRFSEIP